LEEVIKGIPAENIYNMDKKGIQLGIGQKVKAFIDHDQKDVYSVKDNNHELITVIKMVSADGSCLQPSVIYQGKQHNLEWGQNNPCNTRYVLFSVHIVVSDLYISISHLPKGWADQELGELWMMKDFKPATSARNMTQGP